MNNKIDQLFTMKRNKILSLYVTAGIPELNDTIENIKILQDSGVDIIEVGIPYSDPLADGPIIQEANQQAIENGMNLNLLFEQLISAKEEIYIPLILMGYLNVVMQFGIERFYNKCHEAKISGVIIPDMPIDEFQSYHKPFANKSNIKNIFLITPETSTERIKEIDKISDPFIYVISSNSITGNSLSDFEALKVFYEKLNSLHLKNKTLIGFGISNSTKFQSACELANGAIIGSAFITALKKKIPIHNFINEIIHYKNFQL